MEDLSMRRAWKLQRRQRRAAKRQRRSRRRSRLKTWLDCMQHFLTSHFWRVAHRAAGPFQAVRWKLLPLLLVCMMSMLCPAKADKDRFEVAREYYIAMYPHGKRPGKKHAGFLDALARLPRLFFKAVLPVLRQRTAVVLKHVWTVDGWIPFGVDGSRLALPRYATLERHFGTAGTGDFPHLWITSIVHLATGVPWSWRFGRSDASERHQFCALVPTLPEGALLMADAGFVGYEVWETLLQHERHFLIRLGSNVQLYADYEVRADFSEGQVYLWPISKPHKKPLALRLVRLPAQGNCKHDVWLATNTDEKELSRETISKMFRLRWQHEVFYRSYKCTLNKTKLSSRTTRQVLREAELAMMAVQLFTAQAAWAVGEQNAARTASCAEALRQVHREWRYLLKHGRLQQRFLERLGKACREHRPTRTSAKNYRAWPRKRQHKAPAPPQIAAYPEELKARLLKEDMAA
jgi:hypothetical protein